VNDINQCLLHILKNAVDSVENEGIIKVICYYNKENCQIVVSVIDNGKGMSPEVIRQVFNPFFTTKPIGSGTGSGLTIAERIIKHHSGKIQITSKEKFGSTVVLQIPVNT